jgi:hypothetical protein
MAGEEWLIDFLGELGVAGAARAARMWGRLAAMLAVETNESEAAHTWG